LPGGSGRKTIDNLLFLKLSMSSSDATALPFGTEAGLKYRPNPLNSINIKKPFKVLAPLLAPLKMT